MRKIRITFIASVFAIAIFVLPGDDSFAIEPVTLAVVSAGLNLFAQLIEISDSGANVHLKISEQNRDLLISMQNRMILIQTSLNSIEGKLEKIPNQLQKVFEDEKFVALEAAINNINISLKSIKEQHDMGVKKPDTLADFKHQVNHFIDLIHELTQTESAANISLIPAINVYQALIELKFSDRPEIIDIETNVRLKPIVDSLRKQLLPSSQDIQKTSILQAYLDILKEAEKARTALWDWYDKNAEIRYENVRVAYRRLAYRNELAAEESICHYGVWHTVQQGSTNKLDNLISYLELERKNAKEFDIWKFALSLILQEIQYYLFVNSDLTDNLLVDGYYLPSEHKFVPAVAFVRYHEDFQDALLLVEGSKSIANSLYIRASDGKFYELSTSNLVNEAKQLEAVNSDTVRYASTFATVGNEVRNQGALNWELFEKRSKLQEILDDKNSEIYQTNYSPFGLFEKLDQLDLKPMFFETMSLLAHSDSSWKIYHDRIKHRDALKK